MDHPVSTDRFLLSFEHSRDRSSQFFRQNPLFSDTQRSFSLEFAPTKSTADMLNTQLKRRRVELLGKVQEARNMNVQNQNEESSSEQEKFSLVSQEQESSSEDLDLETDLLYQQLAKLSMIEEELVQKHMVQWTNNEVSRTQARTYEKKWAHIKQKLCLLNYECQFLKRDITDLQGYSNRSKTKQKEHVVKEKAEIHHKILNTSLKRSFRTFLNFHFLSKHEMSLETGIDIFSNFRSLKKKGLVVRYMKFDPLMESSSYVHEITKRQQYSYFINFQIHSEILIFEVLNECCRMWNINEESAILTDQYFNIISTEALTYTPVYALFKNNYRFLNEENILILYIFQNKERAQTHIKRIQSYLTNFSNETDFSFSTYNKPSEKINAKIKNIAKANRGISIYEEADQELIDKVNNSRRCRRGQFILSPFGLISFVILLLIILILKGKNHNTKQEYWMKKAIQEILLDSHNSASEIKTANQFYQHQIQKYISLGTAYSATDLEVIRFEIRSITETKSQCSRSPSCFGLSPANTQTKTIHRGTDSYILYNSMSNQQYDLIDSIQNFEANFYEAIPGSHFYSPDDIPLLLDAYQRSEYIDADTRFVIIQVYFKYEQGRHYIGIGQEVYEVKGPNSVFFRSIDSSVFQPNLLDNQASKPSYVIYGIALFCIMLGCLFFLVLNIIRICKLRRTAANSVGRKSKIWSKIRSVFYKAVVILLCSLHFSDLSSLALHYSDSIKEQDEDLIELNFSYLAIYSFISMAVLAIFLFTFKYSRLCFKCFLKFKAVVEAIPSILMIYLSTVLFFLWFSLIISQTSLSDNSSIHNPGLLFLNEFQLKKSPSIQVESRSESQLFLLIPLYLFGMIVLFTSMPFAFLLETKRKFYKFYYSENHPKLPFYNQFKAWLCNWKKSKKVKQQKQ